MIEIKTREQIIELAARSVYLLSGLRAWQRDLEENRSITFINKDPDTAKWEIRCDEFLKNIEATDFISLKELISHLSKNS